MEDKRSIVELAVAVTTAWLGNPNTRCTPEDVHAFLKNSHATLVGFAQPASEVDEESAEAASEFKPAVTVRKSLADPDYLVSMIDGKRYRALRRHLSSHGLTPETYRERYGLRPDYPMVAPAYAAQRSRLAKELGLGRKGAEARAAATARVAEVVETSASVPTEKKPHRQRTKKVARSAPQPAEA